MVDEKKKYLTPELQKIVADTDKVVAEIRRLRAKERLTMVEIRLLAVLKAELIRLCPPVRYEWIEGLPSDDILRMAQQIEEDI